MVLPQLRRVRWAVRATLVLGVAASVIANVLHALDNPISQAIAAWPPLALLLTVELISRVPVHRRSLAWCRLFATATIAGIAAWVSYWHMAGVASRYGETGASPYLLPLSVDGLIVVASICLVELGGRIAALESARASTPTVAESRLPAAAPVPGPIPVSAAPGPSPARRLPPEAAAAVAAALPNPGAGGDRFEPRMTRQPRTAPAPRRPADRQVAAARSAVASRAGVSARADAPTGIGRTPASGAAAPVHAKATGRPTTVDATPGHTPAVGRPTDDAVSGRAEQPRARRTREETLALADRIRAERPGVTDAELAESLGISLKHWRTVSRDPATA